MSDATGDSWNGSGRGGRMGRITEKVTKFRNKPPEITTLEGRQALKWLAIVAVLFFSWGVAQGLVGGMIEKYDVAYGLTKAQKSGLSGTYFAAYAFSSVSLGGYLMRSHGFCLTAVTGLVLYGIGCMCFWPSSVHQSYAGIVICHALIGIGCSLLEIAANLFATLCGPPNRAPVRLCLSQAIQGVGGLLALLMQTDETPESGNPIKNPHIMKEYQWLYLGVGIAVFIYAAGVYCSNIPEFDNKESSFLASNRQIFSTSRTHALTFLGAFLSMSIYVSAQEAVRAYAGPYLRLSLSLPQSTNYRKLTQGLFTASRFLTSIALYIFLAPSCALMLASMLLFVSSIVTLAAFGTVGGAVGALISNFMMGGLFPLTFVLAIRGLPTNGVAKTASSWLISAVGGGAVLPRIWEAIMEERGWREALATVVVACAMLVAYPAFLVVTEVRERLREDREERARANRGDGFGGEEGGVETVMQQGVEELMPPHAMMGKGTMREFRRGAVKMVSVEDDDEMENAVMMSGGESMGGSTLRGSTVGSRGWSRGTM